MMQNTITAMLRDLRTRENKLSPDDSGHALMLANASAVGSLSHLTVEGERAMVEALIALEAEDIHSAKRALRWRIDCINRFKEEVAKGSYLTG